MTGNRSCQAFFGSELSIIVPIGESYWGRSYWRSYWGLTPISLPTPPAWHPNPWEPNVTIDQTNKRSVPRDANGNLLMPYKSQGSVSAQNGVVVAQQGNYVTRTLMIRCGA